MSGELSCSTCRPGTHELRVFLEPTPARQLGRWLSLATLLTCGGVLVVARFAQSATGSGLNLAHHWPVTDCGGRRAGSYEEGAGPSCAGRDRARCCPLCWLSPGVRWSREPAEVADHAGAVRGTRSSCGLQTRRSSDSRSKHGRITCRRLDVILAAAPEHPPPDGRLILHLRRDVPGADVSTSDDIRTVEVPVRELGLPRRPVLDLRPGQPAEQWTALAV